MADKDETFDPNDLDSIDALLDEAELEAASEEQVEPDQAADNADVTDMDDFEVEEQSEETESNTDATAGGEDDVFDSLDELVADAEANADTTEQANENIEQANEQLAADPEPEVVGVSEPFNDMPEVTNQIKEKSEMADESDKAADDFLEKRAAAQASQNSNLSVEEMDSIKKLIIIFGSVLSVLAIAAIGVGVWSAMAAGASAMDDDTKKLIESIKVSSERNGSAIKDAESVTKSVEKKIDAINFSLNQLATDIADLSTAKADNVIDPLGLGQPAKEQAAKPTAAAPVAASTSVVADAELMKKVSTVSSRLYRTQKSIDEVNKRIKAMQSQSAALMQSLKIVEKEALITLEAREKRLKEQEARNKGSRPYSYSTGGGMYDQSNLDSYP